MYEKIKALFCRVTYLGHANVAISLESFVMQREDEVSIRHYTECMCMTYVTLAMGWPGRI